MFEPVGNGPRNVGDFSKKFHRWISGRFRRMPSSSLQINIKKLLTNEPELGKKFSATRLRNPEIQKSQEIAMSTFNIEKSSPLTIPTASKLQEAVKYIPIDQRYSLGQAIRSEQEAENAINEESVFFVGNKILFSEKKETKDEDGDVQSFQEYTLAEVKELLPNGNYRVNIGSTGDQEVASNQVHGIRQQGDPLIKNEEIDSLVQYLNDHLEKHVEEARLDPNQCAYIHRDETKGLPRSIQIILDQDGKAQVFAQLKVVEGHQDKKEHLKEEGVWLGSGGFKERVAIALDCNTGELVCSALIKNPEEVKKSLEEFRHQQAAGVGLGYCIYTSSKTEMQHAMLFMPLANCGTMKEYFLEHPKNWSSLTGEQKKSILLDMAEILKKFNAAEIVNRDIKLDNFLLDQRKEKFHVMMTDWGLAVRLVNGELPEGVEVGGTVTGLPPEVYDHQGVEGDAFALGLAILELKYGGKLPPAMAKFISVIGFPEKYAQRYQDYLKTAKPDPLDALCLKLIHPEWQNERISIARALQELEVMQFD